MIDNHWIKAGQIPIIKKDVLYLFRIDIGSKEFENVIPEKIPFLQFDEVERLKRYKFNKDKLRFGVCRFVIRNIFSKNLDVDCNTISMSFNAFGKPYYNNEKGLKFNIAHSGDLLLVGVCLNYELGLDTEVYNYNIDHLDLSRHVFSKLEQTALNQLGQDRVVEAFYNCWSLKESFIKAMGKGLGIPLSDFSVKLFNEDDKSNLLEVSWDSNLVSVWRSLNFSIKKDYAAAYTYDYRIKNHEYIDLTQMVTLSLT